MSDNGNANSNGKPTVEEAVKAATETMRAAGVTVPNRHERRAAEKQAKADAPTLPADPAVYSPAWYDNLIVANEVNLRQQQGNVSQLRKQLADAEQAEQRIVGALEALRALKLMGGNAQA